MRTSHLCLYRTLAPWLLLLLGCGNNSPDGSCARACTSCPSGQQCIVTDNTAAVCLAECTTTADCASGFRCVELVENSRDFPTPPTRYSARVCAQLSSTPLCPGVPSGSHCDIFAGSVCSDSTTLKRPVFQPGTCGFEYVRCDNGCVEGTTPNDASCG